MKWNDSVDPSLPLWALTPAFLTPVSEVSDSLKLTVLIRVEGHPNWNVPEEKRRSLRACQQFEPEASPSAAGHSKKSCGSLLPSYRANLTKGSLFLWSFIQRIDNTANLLW